MTIDRSKLAIGICPLVPYAYAMLLQVFHVGVALKEPQQLIDNGLQMQLLGREQREAVVKIVSALCSKDAQRACAGAVSLLRTFSQDSVEDVEILFHDDVFVL